MKIQKNLVNFLNKNSVQKFCSKQKKISLWKNISTTTDDYDTVNFLIEIPYLTSAKIQLEKSDKNHAFLQDKRKINGVKVPRFYQQIVDFNYGFIPSTWENCLIKDEKFSPQYKGDDDPLDCIELSNIKLESEKTYRGKILGSLGLVDQGEIDWKILLLEEKQFNKLNLKEEQILNEFQHKINYIREWFRFSKTFEFKNENDYLNNGEIFDKKTTIEIIKECQSQFSQLLSNNKYKQIRDEYHLN